MRLLVTRPLGDARRTAKALEARGHEAVLLPLIEIRPNHEASVDLAGVQAILTTSANGVRLFAKSSVRRDLPLFAVGTASAAVAHSLGFADVRAAEGDVASLVELVARESDASAGVFLHVAGSDLAGDLKSSLSARGFAVRRATLYDSRPIDRPLAEIQRPLADPRLDGVLFFSPRTARIFVDLARRAEAIASCRRLGAYCLSPNVAKVLPPLTFARVRVAARRDQGALLDLLDSE